MTSVFELFADDIHLTSVGNYVIACVMYASIHGESPEGLPHQLFNEWGIPYSDHPTPEQATIFQRIAWNTVCAYKKSGTTCSPTSVIDNHSSQIVRISPNPATNNFHVDFGRIRSVVHVTLHNLIGEAVISRSYKFTQQADIQLSTPPGIYVLTLTFPDGTISSRTIIVQQ
jgi:hypothetical protein